MTDPRAEGSDVPARVEPNGVAPPAGRSRGRHSAPDERTASPPPPGFLAELREAVSVRTFVLVFGVLMLQVGFVLSYVGAFHRPVPHRVLIVVAAPAQVAGQLIGQLNGLNGEPLLATAATDEAAARMLLVGGSTSAALIVNQSGTTDALLVASAGGASTATAVEQVINQAEAAQQRTVTVTDVVPTQPGDARGLTGFYLVVGWTVGGYLVASLLGVAKGARPATRRRALIRLLAVVPYAIISGWAGALVVGPVLGALTGHLVGLWLVGALLVYAAAAVTMAFQVLFGVLGIGLTVLLFVVLGNPSAGGAYAPELLPPFWRAISGVLPNGAGTAAVRRIAYFGANHITGNILVIAAYAVVGTAVALGVTALRRPGGVPADPIGDLPS